MTVGEIGQEVQGDRFREAFERLAGDIRKVDPAELVAINIDIPLAVTNTLGSLHEIQSFRARIVAMLNGYDVARFDQLEDSTRALGFAHATYLTASSSGNELEKLVTEGIELRETLYTDAQALVRRRLLDENALNELKGTNGYRNLAFDLLSLSALLRRNWDKISGKTALQSEELSHAAQLSDQILTTVGFREQGTAVLLAAVEERQRAFSFFVKTYDHVRRALSFLRWNEGDLEQIAPSLYANRTGAKRKAGESLPQNPNAPSGSTAGTHPVPAGAGPSVPAAAISPQSVGFPGSDPFGRS